MIMKILWLTARSFTDLCSTTQQALIHGLLSEGFEVQLINGDEHVSVEEEGFVHTPLSRSSRRGFQASSLASHMVQWLEENQLDSSKTIAVVEWRVARRIAPTLNRLHIRWMLMDRSPPADAGLFGWLQWRSWRKAWSIARKQDVLGFVVSPAHKRFVDLEIGHKKTSILPAGVDLNLFKPMKKHEILTMVYHGRLDRHRGIMAAVMLAHKARQNGVKINLKLIGEGDAATDLQSIASEVDYIEVKEKMEQAKVAQEIAACHIGVLPMPKRTAWVLASPLKRSEYLASGLCVFGVDHDGHRLDQEEPWFVLAAQEDFHEMGLEYLKNFTTHDNVQTLEVRAFAEQHCGWDKAITNLKDGIHRTIADS
jgi:glycosyltransferase involved in cell wall biosynthesis